MRDVRRVCHDARHYAALRLTPPLSYYAYYYVLLSQH